MRGRWLVGVAVSAVVITACSGKAPAPQTSDAATDAAVSAPSAETAAATTGTRHRVDMVLDGSSYAYRPAQLTIKPGDEVVFHGVSGGAHNVEFWADSLPEGAAAVLTAGISSAMSPLASNLIPDGDSIVVRFAGAPAGRYPYFCLPHQAMGMQGEITVTP
jgi:plastocyanin